MTVTPLPGEELVAAGVEDLERGAMTVPAALVSIAATRLRGLGLRVPDPLGEPELRLFELLARDDPDGAHSRYNALLRQLVSYVRAAESRGRTQHA